MAIEMIKPTPLEYKVVPKGNKTSSDKAVDAAELPGAGKDVLADKVYLNRAIGKLKDAGDIFKRRLDFKIDDETNRVVVKVIDTETNKVVKEIPPEQLVRLAAKIQEMIGLLVDEER
ncbi:MAG: flagellar protein FlaG [Spirochaetes bacterium]|nr:flagellar protein FlaG [Spirochaetota bacterium]